MASVGRPWRWYATWAIGLLLMAATPLAATGATAGAEAASTTQAVSWFTDELEGDFAVRLDMQFTETTFCEFRIAGAGALRPFDLLLFLGRDDNPAQGAALLGGGGNVVNIGPAGFGFHTTPNQFWLASITGTGTQLPGRQAWVFAAFGVQPLGVQHPITDGSFEFSVTCDASFILHGVDATREAFGAANPNLGEGVGARLSPPGTDVNINANLADGATRATTGTETVVIAHDFADDPTAGGGLFVHDPPGSAEAVPFTPGTLRYHHLGPPGAHSVKVNYLAAGLRPDLYVMILGFRPVDGVEALDDWAELPTY